MSPKANTKQAMGTSSRSGDGDRDEQGWEEVSVPLSVSAAPPWRAISLSVLLLGLKKARLKKTGCGLGLGGFSCVQTWISSRAQHWHRLHWSQQGKWFGDGGSKGGGSELAGGVLSRREREGDSSNPYQSIVTSAVSYSPTLAFFSCRRSVQPASPGLYVVPLRRLTQSVCSPGPVVLLRPRCGMPRSGALCARLSDGSPLPLPWQRQRRHWCERGCKTQRATSYGKRRQSPPPPPPVRSAVTWARPPPHSPEGALTFGTGGRVSFSRLSWDFLEVLL